LHLFAFELFASVVKEDELVNTLKPLLIVAVLAGVGYGVYVRINSGNDAPPPGVAAGWDAAAPTVQLPGTPAPAGSGIAPPFGGVHNGTPAPPAVRGETPTYPPTSDAPPYAANGSSEAPYNDPATGAPIPPESAGPDPARANPYTYLPPHDSDTAGRPPVGAPAATQPGYDAPAADRYRGPAAGGPPPTEGGSASGFSTAMNSAQRELEAGQMASALRQLSSWYDDPQLTIAQRQQLHQVLDQVAGTVVYSTQHLLESPYEVQPGERLEDIAQRYNIPWQLLAKINGIDQPQNLRPGERLKVVRGPFSALVSLEKRELTLLLADGSYAGRFPIGIGLDHPPQEGVYAVAEKAENPVYHGRDRAISAEDPSNPLGERWIGLGSSLGIHGTNRPDLIGRTDLPGSISLSPRDVEDVYDILTVGSKVTIRR
jgi:LysM repeat protein